MTFGVTQLTCDFHSSLSSALESLFTHFYTAVDLRSDHSESQDIELKGRKVSHGNGNIVSIQYECFILFEPGTEAWGSIFSMFGISKISRNFLYRGWLDIMYIATVSPQQCPRNIGKHIHFFPSSTSQGRCQVGIYHITHLLNGVLCKFYRRSYLDFITKDRLASDDEKPKNSDMQVYKPSKDSSILSGNWRQNLKNAHNENHTAVELRRLI